MTTILTQGAFEDKMTYYKTKGDYCDEVDQYLVIDSDILGFIKKNKLKEIIGMKFESVYIKNEEFTIESIDEYFIIMKNDDLDNIYILDDISKLIFDLIDGKRKVNEIKLILLENYEVSDEELSNDILTYLYDLENKGFIEKIA